MAAPEGEVVLTSGTTASINLVAQSWGRARVGPGDAVDGDHARAPLQPGAVADAVRRARRELRVAPVGDDGAIDVERAGRAARRAGPPGLRLAPVQRHRDGSRQIAEIALLAHAAGAHVLVDGAQAIAHLDVDVDALGCDFYAFSGHKLYGPPGTGVLWARAELLDEMPPWQGGGEMVASVDVQGARYREPPYRFEAGTPNIAGVVGLGAAVHWWRGLDRAAVSAHEAAVHARLLAAIAAAPGVRVLGAPEAAVVAFTVDGVHPHDVATIVDQAGVAIRSGHHCAQPLHRRFGLEASARASIGVYSGDDDVEALAAALAGVRDVLGGPR